MILRLDNYSGRFRIVSLALDEYTKDDLIREGLDLIYLSENELVFYPENYSLKISSEIVRGLKRHHNYDVFELRRDGTLVNCYDDSSIDNCLFVTGRCNSNCVMCPSSESARKDAKKANINELIEIAKHIPSDTHHLTITGGEPFMAGEEIFDLLVYLKRKFDHTEFLVLTNGRIFALDKYIDQLKEKAPNDLIFAIPIHGSDPELHDAITQSKNSFIQTVLGIRRLLENDFKVEMRLVACRLNDEDFEKIADLIVREFSGVSYVSIMAPEMTGNAFRNRSVVWEPYSVIFEKVESALVYLLEHNIDVKLYNFPLCTVKSKYRTLCEKSISPSKVRYGESCEECLLKDACGGLFAGTYALEHLELKAII